MIGRTAPANPWIFRQIEQYCEALAATDVNGWDYTAHERAGVHARPVEQGSTSVPPSHDDKPLQAQEQPRACPELAEGADVPTKPLLYDEPSESDRYQMIRTYFRMLIEEELPDATGKMKQFASWFTHGVPGGAALRKEIYDSKAAPEILARVEDFFEARLAISPELPEDSLIAP